MKSAAIRPNARIPTEPRGAGSARSSNAKILVVDVGGTNIKILATGQAQPRKIPSGPRMTAKQMVRDVQRAAKDWDYEFVSIGYPGPAPCRDLTVV